MHVPSRLSRGPKPLQGAPAARERVEQSLDQYAVAEDGSADALPTALVERAASASTRSLARQTSNSMPFQQ